MALTGRTRGHPPCTENTWYGKHLVLKTNVVCSSRQQSDQPATRVKVRQVPVRGVESGVRMESRVDKRLSVASKSRYAKSFFLLEILVSD